MKPHFRTIASLAVVLASMTSLAAAQNEHRIGFQGGITLAKLSGKGAADLNPTNRAGFLAGVFAELQLSPNFAISPEVNYVVKGTKISDGSADGNIKISYLQVPLLFKVLVPVKSSGKTQIRPQFYAGPAIGFKSGCDFKISDGTTSLSGKCSDPGLDATLKSTDFSVIVGAGLGVGPVFFGARYDLGLIDINNDAAATADDAAKNRALSFMVGVSFPLHKK